MTEATLKSKRQPSAAFMKPVQPDDKLAEIIGKEPVARTEVTRKLWDYIRSHELQDPENKTFIKADDKLKAVFDGKDRVSMFEMLQSIAGTNWFALAFAAFIFDIPPLYVFAGLALTARTDQKARRLALR